MEEVGITGGGGYKGTHREEGEEGGRIICAPYTDVFLCIVF